MDLPAFRASLAQPQPPDGVSLPLQALWWDARGDWHKAHECAQADHSSAAAAVHAYLHRKEPDLANAQYWYARAGRTPVTATLEAEWDALVAEMTGS